jgi:hypothetical protein
MIGDTKMKSVERMFYVGALIIALIWQPDLLVVLPFLLIGFIAYLSLR